MQIADFIEPEDGYPQDEDIQKTKIHIPKKKIRKCELSNLVGGLTKRLYLVNIYHSAPCINFCFTATRE